MWYAQTDPRWASQRLGICDGVTIGSAGCYVTAFANMANDCLKEVTPAQLDDIFTGDGSSSISSSIMYADGCLCFDNMLERVYPDIHYVATQNFPGPADLSQLNNDVSVKQILELDAFPNTPGLQTHFVYFHHIDGGTVWIIDSETGQLADLSKAYGDPVTAIYKIVTYNFTYPKQETPPPPPPVDPDPVVPPVHDPVTPPTPLPDPVVPAPLPPVSEPVNNKEKSMSKYNKALVAVAGIAVQMLGLAVGVSNPWYIAVVAVLTALGVYHVANA